MINPLISVFDARIAFRFVFRICFGLHLKQKNVLVFKCHTSKVSTKMDFCGKDPVFCRFDSRPAQLILKTFKFRGHDQSKAVLIVFKCLPQIQIYAFALVAVFSKTKVFKC